jgi:Caspase domain.
MRFAARIVLFLTLIFLITCTPATAQRRATMSIGAKAAQAYERGEFRESLRLYRLAEQEAAKGARFSNLEWSQGYLGMAECLRAMGQFEESEKYFKIAYDYASKVSDKQYWTMSRILNAWGSLKNDRGNYADAEKLWMASEKLEGYEFWPINNLAKLYLEWGKFDEARVYVDKAIQQQRKFKKMLAVPYGYFNQGFLAQSTGKYPEAEAHYKESIKTSAQVVGKKHLYYAMSLSALAYLYMKEARFVDAEQLLREALALQSDILPSDHPELVKMQVMLARVLRDEGRYAEAEEVVNKALKAYEGLYNGPDNVYTARAKAVLGTIKRQNGQYDESAALLETALKTVTETLGTSSLEVAEIKRELAKVKLDQGKLQESESLLKESLADVQRIAGPDHPDRAVSALALGNLYVREERFADAEPQFKAALELSERVFGQDNVATADSARDLGNLYLKEKKFDQAQAYLKEAMAIDEKLYGAKSPQVASDLFSLANALDSQKQSVESAPLIERANAIRTTMPGGTANVPAPVTGQQIIEVAAAPVGGTTRSAKASASASDRPVRNKWALAIGISNFKDPAINLKYAAKDATDFSSFLVAKQHFKADNVKLLTNEQATRQSIIEMLGDKWLGKVAQKDDLVLVYVSSHGSSSQDSASGVNFLVAHDTNKESLLATGIPMQWLVQMVKDQVHCDRVILVLDVCHSGAAAGGKALSRIAGMVPTELAIGTGQMVLCSSMAEQVSWESKNYENSVFTRRLIEALQSNQDKTTMKEAYQQLKFLVESEVLRDRCNLQTPVLWNKEWIGNDPVLAIEPTG